MPAKAKTPSKKKSDKKVTNKKGEGASAKGTVAKKTTAKTGASKKTSAKSAGEQKTQGKKTTARKKSPNTSVQVVSPEQRWKMIADAAYLKAERRGFAAGNELDDWTQAEREIDAMLSKK